MAKRKIGCSRVEDGVARGWFQLPERLPKGVYQLLGEYQGNEVYKPSYDVKYLIVGNGTAFTGLSEIYKVKEDDRRLRVTGRLVGYDENNDEVGLANQKIYLKLGDLNNPLSLTNEERSLDAVNLKTITDDAFVLTNSNGFFTFEGYIPEKFSEWEYQLYINFGGNYDYVSCSESRVVRIGLAPVYVRLEVFPSTHVHPQSGFLLRASVYLKKEIDTAGNPISGAQRIQVGNVIFKESNTGQNNTWSTMLNDTGIAGSTEKMAKQNLNLNDGYVLHRYMFNRDEDDNFDKYIYCQYSGAESGIGYKPAQSDIVHLKIDSTGTKLDNVVCTFPCASTVTTPIFKEYGESRTCAVTLKYSNGTNVPNGKVTTELE